MSKSTVGILDSLIATIKEYASNRIDLVKLKLISKVSAIASAIVTGIILFVVFFILFVVLNIGLALLIGDWIGKSYAGFLILAGFYAIVGVLILMKGKKMIQSMVSGMLIGKIYKNAKQKN